MMKGATIPPTMAPRKAADTTTIAPSHAQTGTRPSLRSNVDLGETLGELRGLGRRRRDTDLRRSLAHLAQHRVDDRRPPFASSSAAAYWSATRSRSW